MHYGAGSSNHHISIESPTPQWQKYKPNGGKVKNYG